MAPQEALKDPASERALYRFRFMIASVLMGLMLLVIIGRYFFLQVVEHDTYKTQSDRNRIQLQAIAPKRGLIYDRNGVLLAENIPSYSLVVIRERVDDLHETLDIIDELVGLDEDERKKFDRSLRHRRPYQATPVKYRLTEEQIAILAANRYRLPGVDIDAQLVRHYPYSELMAHVLGYVGRINERELGEIDQVNYSATNHIGKLGVEHFYEDKLHGMVGYQNVETNARGRVLRVLERYPPVPGADLQLNLDIELQRIAQEALGEERGAIVAIDPADGGVLAMVSTPSYDINLFVHGISNADYSRLRDSKDLPLFNRTIQGQYPPGSTLKPVFGLAGLHYGVITPYTTVRDPGWYRLPNEERLYRDWKDGGHGNHMNLRDSIAESCDTYFYDLAYHMGIDRIHDFGKQFGLGEPTGVDIDHERSGLLPSREWKERTRGGHWFPGETLNVGIGQGMMLTTPMQLADVTATLANRGVRKQPRIVSHINGVRIADPVVQSVEPIADKHWDYIVKSMEEVVHGQRGTAKGISRGLKYAMAGKTGTAQMVGIVSHEDYDPTQIAKRKRDHALFVGFAPVNEPLIAVAVIVENGEAGSRVAAPIARKVMDAYINDLYRAPVEPVDMKPEQSTAQEVNGSGE